MTDHKPAAGLPLFAWREPPDHPDDRCACGHRREQHRLDGCGVAGCDLCFVFRLAERKADR